MTYYGNGIVGDDTDNITLAVSADTKALPQSKLARVREMILSNLLDSQTPQGTR